MCWLFWEIIKVGTASWILGEGGGCELWFTVVVVCGDFEWLSSQVREDKEGDGGCLEYTTLSGVYCTSYYF